MRRILSKTQLQVSHALTPTPLKDLGKHRVVDMAMGPTHSAVLVDSGRVVTFGRNTEGQLGAGNLTGSGTPLIVKGLGDKAVVSLVSNYQNNSVISQ